MNVTLKKGMQIKVKTKTKGDVFGTVVYEIADVLPNGDVRCVILHGTGPSARPGYPINDTVDAILQNIADGVTEIVPDTDRSKFKNLEKLGSEVKIAGRNGMGIEM